MASFIMLGNFTEQGLRNAKDTTKRYDAFREIAEKAGVTIKHVYWTLGQYDVVTICEADDEVTATALLFSLAAQGNIRTQTLRAFSKEEMDRIVARML